MLNIVKSAFGGKKILVGLALLSLVLGVAAPVLADTEGTVTATVTPQIISVTVSDGDVDYGILDVSETADTITLTQTQTITNTSNISVDVAVKSSDAVGDTTNWNLVAAASIAADDYGHQYQIETSGNWIDFPATNDYTATVDTLDESDGTDPDAALDLKVYTPTSISDTSAHSITVTVLATEYIP